MQGSSADSTVCGYNVDRLEDDECCVICLDCIKEMMFLPCGPHGKPHGMTVPRLLAVHQLIHIMYNCHV